MNKNTEVRPLCEGANKNELKKVAVLLNRPFTIFNYKKSPVHVKMSGIFFIFALRISK